jgi:hypothetical protein
MQVLQEDTAGSTRTAIVAGMPAATWFTAAESVETHGYLARLLRRIRGGPRLAEPANDAVEQQRGTPSWNTGLRIWLMLIPGLVVLVFFSYLSIRVGRGLGPEILSLGCILTICCIPIACLTSVCILLALRITANVVIEQQKTHARPDHAIQGMGETVVCPRCGSAVRDGPEVYSCSACRSRYRLSIETYAPEFEPDTRIVEGLPPPRLAAAVEKTASASGLDQLQRRLRGWRDCHAIQPPVAGNTQRRRFWTFSLLKAVACVACVSALGLSPAVFVLWSNFTAIDDPSIFLVVVALTMLALAAVLSLAVAAVLWVMQQRRP